MKSGRELFFFAACLLCTACQDPSREEARRMRNLPEQEQRQALANLPAEKRREVALYLVEDEARRIIFDLHDEREQGQALARLPAEKQLDIVAYGTRVEPGALLAGAVAPNWKTILPELRSRLGTETDHSILMEYMMILDIISISHCSLADREDVVAVARQGFLEFTRRLESSQKNS